MADTAQGFSNVRRTRFWQRGFLASQSAYVLVALIVLIIIMSMLSPHFLTDGNVKNVVRNFSFVAIATLGITLVIITGGIDLSVGSTMALSATVCSLTMAGLNSAGFYPFPGSALIISLAAGIGTALVIGLANGFAIAKLKLARLSRRSARSRSSAASLMWPPRVAARRRRARTRSCLSPPCPATLAGCRSVSSTS